MFLPLFPVLLRKKDVFLHGAFNGEVPPDLSLPDGLLLGPVHPQRKKWWHFPAEALAALGKWF